MRAWLAFAAMLLLMPQMVRADELRPGYLELNEVAEGAWQMGWKIPITKAPDALPPAPVIPDICSYSSEPEIGLAGTAIVGFAVLECRTSLAGKSLSVESLTAQSDLLVRMQPIGEDVQALRMTGRDPSVTFASDPGTMQVLRTYFVLGVEHILAGWDHLLFVIALVLLIGKWRMVVLAATAFTLSHSITLAAASLGFVGLPQKPVEALIALSILFLALEVVRQSPEQPTLTQRYPWVVAFIFGLLHGFGFAAALTSIGLPEGDVLAALLAFNIGVEAGQLLVIALLLGVLALLRKFAVRAFDPAVRASAYFIGIVGAYWLIDRVVV